MAGFWNCPYKKVCFGVNPAFTEAVTPMKLSTAGDRFWWSSRHGFLGQFKKTMVEVGVGTEDDVRFFSTDDFLEALLILNHASVVKVGYFFQIVKIQMM